MLAWHPRLVAEEEGQSPVTVSQYKLSALTSVGTNAVADYKHMPNPHRRCVMMRLTSGFSGHFVFFATTRSDPVKLEIICFTPREDGEREWSGRFVRLEGETKDRFEKLHALLDDEVADFQSRDDRGEFQPMADGRSLDIQVGKGDEVGWADLPGNVIAKEPERKKRLLQCISLAESLAGIPMSRDIE